MKNVKSVMVLKPTFGLQKDSVLTREANETKFVYESQYAGKDHTISSKVELSPSLLDREYFVAIEWFEPKPLTNKEMIAALESENEFLKTQLAGVSAPSKITKRIDEKIEEYQKEYDRLIKYSDKYYFNGMGDWTSEALTVYQNMLELLKKIKA